MEDFLVDELDKNLTRNENLRVKILMDAYRGMRFTKPGSAYLNSFSMVNRLKVRNINRDVDIGLWRNSKQGLWNTLFRLTQLNEMLGVHHVKLAIFDNSVILTGANMEEQYFLNRRDRYWIINDAEKFCDYLEDLVLTMLSNSVRNGFNDETIVPQLRRGV